MVWLVGFDAFRWVLKICNLVLAGSGWFQSVRLVLAGQFGLVRCFRGVFGCLQAGFNWLGWF